VLDANIRTAVVENGIEFLVCLEDVLYCKPKRGRRKTMIDIST